MTKAGRRAGGGSKQQKAAPAKGPRAPQVTAAQLYQQAQLALRFNDVEAAQRALQQAVRLEPQNVHLADAFACLLAELGDDGAQVALEHAIQLAPESGYEKYMYLAQLEEEPDKALNYSDRGLAMLQRHLEQSQAAAAAAAAAGAGQQGNGVAGGDEDEDAEDPAAQVQRLSRALCSALCTHAEMLLQKAVALRNAAAGDVQPPPTGIDDSTATQIESYCSRAAAVVPTSPEPGQVIASLRSEQGRSEEALAALRASLALWWKPEEGSDDEQLEGEEDGAEEMEEDTTGGQQGAAAMEEEESEEEEDEESGPSYEFRFEAAKLCLELEETTDTAVEILQSLLMEDDSNPDVWHLLTLALYSGHHYEEAIEAGIKGETLLRQLRLPKKHELWHAFEELSNLAKEAAGQQAAALGQAGVKGQ